MLSTGFKVISPIKSIFSAARPFSVSSVRSQSKEKETIVDYTRLNPFAQQEANSSLKIGFGSDVRSSISMAMQSPREDAVNSRLTGIQAGRTVDVFSGNTLAAFQRLDSIVRSNGIARDKRQQRFYLKPGKAREMRRSQKHRRDFMKSFKHMIEVVKDAKRKGY